MKVYGYTTYKNDSIVLDKIKPKLRLKFSIEVKIIGPNKPDNFKETEKTSTPQVGDIVWINDMCLWAHVIDEAVMLQK